MWICKTARHTENKLIVRLELTLKKKQKTLFIHQFILVVWVSV